MFAFFVLDSSHHYKIYIYLFRRQCIYLALCLHPPASLVFSKTRRSQAEDEGWQRGFSALCDVIKGFNSSPLFPEHLSSNFLQGINSISWLGVNLAQDGTENCVCTVSWCTHTIPFPSPFNLSPLICKLQNRPFLIPPAQIGVCTPLPVPASGSSSVPKISASVKCAACVKNRLNEVSQGRRRVSQLMSRFVISHPYASLSCFPPVRWRLSWWGSCRLQRVHAASAAVSLLLRNAHFTNVLQQQSVSLVQVNSPGIEKSPFLFEISSMRCHKRFDTSLILWLSLQEAIKKRAKYTGFTHNQSFDTTPPHVQVQHVIF